VGEAAPPHAGSPDAGIGPSSIVGDDTRTFPGEPGSGRILGNFRIIRPIGRGGMGEVYLARDLTLERDVALKLLPLDVQHDPERRARFEREARAAAALNHPNILTVHAVGTLQGRSFIAAEFVQGETLAQRIAAGPLPLARTLSMAVEIADALSAAHAKGVIHRDLKPANIMVTATGVKVLDFGLARLEWTGEPHTQTGAIMGTPGYMAPEQLEGKHGDARTDVFALGCVIQEMATGARSRAAGRPVSSRALERVVDKCLQCDPDDRWQTAAELKHALQGIRPRRLRWPMGIVAASILLAGLIFWAARTQPSALSNTDVVMVSDFTNSTGDAVFDGTLRHALAIQLEQSPFLRIMDDATVRQDLRLMGRPTGERMSPEIARQICVREAAAATIEGSIARLGRAFAITVQAVSCKDGQTLSREQVQAEDKEHVLQAVGSVAAAMRAKLGESLASIEKLSRPLDRFTTSSLEALQTYARGYELAGAGQFLAAIPLFERAIELDPDFAMAYQTLAIMYSNAGERLRSNEYQRRAFALSDRLTEFERLHVRARYHFFVTGELEKAVDAYQLFIRTYPRYWGAPGELSALYWRAGELQKSLDASSEAVRLEPRVFAPYNNQAIAYTRLGRLAEAKAALKRAQTQKFDTARLHQRLMEIAYLEGDQAAAMKEAEWFAGRQEEYAGLGTEAWNEDALGRRGRARELYRKAAQMARRRGLLESAAQFDEADALADALTGHCATADRVGGPALALALCGRAARSEKLVERTSQMFPHATIWNAAELPAIRAAGALHANDPARALSLLTPARAYDPARSEVPYLRSVAHLRLGQFADAAEGFQKILSNKGAHWGLIYALSYPGLARAALGAGDIHSARQTHRDFLAFWATADRDSPVLAAAHRELTGLAK
jgi:tetratricopeptide (TPR) repeat protein